MRLRIFRKAQDSILDQSEYYRFHSGDDLSTRWRRAVTEAIVKLLRWPEIGAPTRLQSIRLTGVRWIVVPNFPKHLIFYRYLPHLQTLEIIHVLHGARDLERLLDPEA